MGALVTRALRPIKSFNIENRARRVISKEKPTPAPTYPSNIEDLKRTLEAEPDIDEKMLRKDPELNSRLRDVYVTSHGRPEDDITRERQEVNPDRPLPLDRKQVQDFEYGYKEPAKLTYGRTTLKKAMEFISAHQINPTEITASKIAEEYKLKEADVVEVLKYFKTYEMYLPATKKTVAMFAGPANMRKQLAEIKKMEPLGATKLGEFKPGQQIDANFMKKLEFELGIRRGQISERRTESNTESSTDKVGLPNK